VSSSSQVRQRSGSSSLFSEDSIDEHGAPRRSDRSSATSVDRHSSSSSDRMSLFRLPFPKPSRAANHASSVGSVAAGQPAQSLPERTSTSRLDFLNVCQTFDRPVQHFVILLFVISCSWLVCLPCTYCSVEAVLDKGLDFRTDLVRPLPNYFGQLMCARTAFITNSCWDWLAACTCGDKVWYSSVINTDMCRIPKSEVALNQTQFNATLVHLSRGGTVEPLSENVEMHSDCAAQAVPPVTTQVASEAVTSSLQTFPTTTVIAVSSAQLGMFCYIGILQC